MVSNSERFPAQIMKYVGAFYNKPPPRLGPLKRSRPKVILPSAYEPVLPSRAEGGGDVVRRGHLQRTRFGPLNRLRTTVPMPLIELLPKKHAKSQQLCHVPPRISGEGRTP